MTEPDAPAALGANAGRIEIHVAALDHVFNAMDPSPLPERDLAPGVLEFVVGSARELPRHGTLTLLVHVDRPSGPAPDDAVFAEAVRGFFVREAETTRRRLRQLFRRGRTSLVIGIVFLAALVGIGDVAAAALRGSRLGEVVREGLLIGGWVAMWRPIEIFLYDWWPIRAEARLYDRLGEMTVRVARAAAR
jgi:hypothetical protein